MKDHSPHELTRNLNANMALLPPTGPCVYS